jgi:hypothetical protein
LDQLEYLPGYLNRKFEHVPQCQIVCSLTLDKDQQQRSENGGLGLQRCEKGDLGLQEKIIMSPHPYFCFVFFAENENEGTIL